MKKLVLTGAAGRLGSYLREPLTRMCDELVSTDIAAEIGKLYDGESYVQADLADLSAMEAIVKDATMVVHFGAIGDEAPWDDILQSNISRAYNGLGSGLSPRRQAGDLCQFRSCRGHASEDRHHRVGCTA